MARPRLLACDLDGTLLTSAGEVTDTVARALRRAEEAGFTIAVITARPRRDVGAAVRDRVPGSAYWAYGNGAAVFRPGADEPVLRVDFAPAEAERIVATLRSARPERAFAFDLDDTTLVQPPFPPEATRHWNAVTWCTDLALTRPVSKILVWSGAPSDAEAVGALQREVGGAAAATASGGRFIELGPPGADKRTAFLWIAADAGVDLADTVAVGDGLNDRAMLGVAGAGAAPANAPEEVRREADHLLPTNDEDAVAVLVGHLLDRTRTPGPAGTGQAPAGTPTGAGRAP